MPKVSKVSGNLHSFGHLQGHDHGGHAQWAHIAETCFVHAADAQGGLWVIKTLECQIHWPGGCLVPSTQYIGPDFSTQAAAQVLKPHITVGVETLEIVLLKPRYNKISTQGENWLAIFWTWSMQKQRKRERAKGCGRSNKSWSFYSFLGDMMQLIWLTFFTLFALSFFNKEFKEVWPSMPAHNSLGKCLNVNVPVALGNWTKRLFLWGNLITTISIHCL